MVSSHQLHKEWNIIIPSLEKGKQRHVKDSPFVQVTQKAHGRIKNGVLNAWIHALYLIHNTNPASISLSTVLATGAAAKLQNGQPSL